VTGPRCLRLPIFGSAIGMWRRSTGSPILILTLMLWASPTWSHDPSAWGGLFRSRDNGEMWVSANRGQFVSGAIALAISPSDANHLLLGAESGLLRSRNGGRDWTIEPPTIVVGAVFALAFSADGQQTLTSTSLGIFRGGAENSWREASTPEGATPARAIVRSGGTGRVYMAGWTGLYRSDNWGESWSRAAEGLPQEPATALLLIEGSPETLYAIVHGGIWASIDGARSWAKRGAGMSVSNLDALAVDSKQPTRLWAAGGEGLFRSDDGGANWLHVGRPLPEPNTTVHAISASEEAILITTDRGLYRTVDRGESWTLMIGGLPAHLEAGPLVRDPLDPATVYAGFSLIPYVELWRRAADRDSAFARVSLTSLAGAVVFLVALGAVLPLRCLGSYYRASARSAPPARNDRNRSIGETLP
jgi:photosystem II stability/assembly factor-like uncharacterized protein